MANTPSILRASLDDAEPATSALVPSGIPDTHILRISAGFRPARARSPCVNAGRLNVTGLGFSTLRPSMPRK
jgi:hypothetical protein